MLKKILAASTAGVLAVAAMASTTAMAADVTPIVIQDKGKWENVTVELTAELTPNQIEDLLQSNTMVTPNTDNPDLSWKVATDTDAANSYSNIVLSLWSGLKIGKDDIEDGYGRQQPFQFLGGKVNVDLKANVKESVLVLNGKTIPQTVMNAAPTWAYDFEQVVAKDAAGAVVVDANGNCTIAATNANGVSIPVGIKGGPAGYTVDNAGNITAIDANNSIKGSTEKAFTTAMDVSKDVDWLSSVNSQNGYASYPSIAKGSFGLSGTTILENIDWNKSKVNASFSVKMTKARWKEIVSPAVGEKWNWNSATWSDLSTILNSPQGQDVINNVFGLVGESGITNSSGNFVHLAGVSGKLPVKVTKYDEQSGEYDKPLPLPTGTIPIGVGQNATIPQLKALNNGGTIEFEFDKNVNSRIVVGTIFIMSTSGQVALPLGQDYDYSEDGKTLKMKFDAGLTFSEDMLNQLNSFKIVYNINRNSISGVIPGGLGQDNTTSGTIGGTNDDKTNTYDGQLIKITIKANDKAPAKDPTSSSTTSDGGLVSSSTTTSSTPSSSATNSGSNSGEKNPGTGVAVAVAPVVLAAAGAAVVISKKRK